MLFQVIKTCSHHTASDVRGCSHRLSRARGCWRFQAAARSIAHHSALRCFRCGWQRSSPACLPSHQTASRTSRCPPPNLPLPPFAHSPRLLTLTSLPVCASRPLHCLRWPCILLVGLIDIRSPLLAAIRADARYILAHHTPAHDTLARYRLDGNALRSSM